MKIVSIVSTLALFCLVQVSCKKPPVIEGHQFPEGPRKVQFVLYTEQDFSHDNHVIVFSMSIQNESHHSIWDSTLAPMKISEIPGIDHKLVFTKTINYNASLLKTGFYYSITDVGESWYFEAFPAGDTLKLVNFNFR